MSISLCFVFGRKSFHRLLLKTKQRLIDIKQSLLRFWEKEFPQIAPKTNGRGVRQYRKEDVDTIALIYHLVKEKGMTLPGARQKLKDNKEATIRNFEIINRLKEIREELLSIKKELDER